MTCKKKTTDLLVTGIASETTRIIRIMRIIMKQACRGTKDISKDILNTTQQGQNLITAMAPFPAKSIIFRFCCCCCCFLLSPVNTSEKVESSTHTDMHTRMLCSHLSYVCVPAFYCNAVHPGGKEN